MFSSLAIRSASRALLSSTSLRAVQFSSECQAAQRLRDIFEQYRLEHYSQETPTRFKKELVKAAQGKDLKNTSLVQVDSLNQILINIGRPEDRLSEDELKTLLNEAGCSEDSRYIPVATMMQLM